MFLSLSLHTYNFFNKFPFVASRVFEFLIFYHHFLPLCSHCLIYPKPLKGKISPSYFLLPFSLSLSFFVSYLVAIPTSTNTLSFLTFLFSQSFSFSSTLCRPLFSTPLIIFFLCCRSLHLELVFRFPSILFFLHHRHHTTIVSPLHCHRHFLHFYFHFLLLILSFIFLWSIICSFFSLFSF